MRPSRAAAWGLMALGALTACGGQGPLTTGTVQPGHARPSTDDGTSPPTADAANEVPPPAVGGAGGAGGAGGSGGPSTTPSPPVTIDLLPPADALRPFQHAAEVSVAAHGDDVVVSAINIHTDGAETLRAAALLRQVGVAVSHARGDTFAPPINPGFTNSETSDPVVRVTRDGTFWLAAIGVEATGNKGLLLHSPNGGRDFVTIHDDLAVDDKEWMAASPGGGLVLGAEGGLWRFDESGAISTSWVGQFDWTVFGAFDDDDGAHIFQEHDQSSGWSVPIGRAADGALWTSFGSPPYQDVPGVVGDVRLALFSTDSDLMGTTIPISAPGEPAFMPAAAQDQDGRVHVIWYDSSGPAGVLKYARSASAALRDGFLPPMIGDGNACPGGRGEPVFGEAEATPYERRLREYGDLSISDRRVHMAWTHAPALPSRVLVSHLDF